MERQCAVLILLFSFVLCEDPLKSLNSTNPSFWDQYEIVTQPPLEDVAALPSCGEGDQQGRYLCVPYYNCDAKTKEITSEKVDNPQFNLKLTDEERKCQHYLDVCCKIPSGGLPDISLSNGNQNRPNQNQNRPNQNQNRPNQNQNRPNQNQNRPDQNQNRPDQNQNRPDQNQNRPNVSQNRPDVNQNRPNKNPNRLNGNPNQPNGNQNRPNQDENNQPIVFRVEGSQPITSPPITSRPVTRPPITSPPITSRPTFASVDKEPGMRRPVVNPGTDLCGIRNKNGIDFQVTGNKDNEAEFGEFPWMVALLEKSDDPKVQVSFCGGSLIAPNVVLTGAHCLRNRTANSIKIRAGEWDSQTQKERIPYQERDVRRFILHEDYNTAALYNDVALLILNRPLSKVESVGTICLPDQGQRFDSTRCIATGWGKDKFGKSGQYAVIMKKIELPLVHNADCQTALRTTRLGNRFSLHKSFICAGGERDIDTCTGDGGGPLACPHPNNPNRYVQVGIVSWGISCGAEGIPGVYGDVTQFRSWIDQKLQQASIGSASYTIEE